MNAVCIPAGRTLIGLSAGAALALSTAVSADVEIAYSGESMYVYKVTHVPDHDQVRDGLAANGTVHCVPTSAMNWMCYFANHGQPAILPGPGNWQHPVNYPVATTHIAGLGAIMLTTPPDGTYGSWAVFGISAWLHDWPVFVIRSYVDDDFCPRMQHAAALAMGGAYVLIGVGWYLEDPGGLVFRDGGHSLTLNRALRNGSQMQIGWRDPGSHEGDLSAQSPFETEKYAVSDVLRIPFLFGGPKTMSKIEGYGGGGKQGYIDSVTAILPLFAPTPMPDFSGLRRQLVFSVQGTDIPPVRDYLLPEHTSLVDMVLHPDAKVACLLQDDGGVTRLYFLDLLTGAIDPADDGITLTDPTQVIVGRRRDLYVVDGDELVRVNVDKDPPEELGRRDLPAPAGPMVYDDLGDNVLLLAPGTRQVLAYPHDLDGGPLMFGIPPEVLIGDEPAICWNFFDGSGWLVSQASSGLWRLVINPDTGVVTAEMAAMLPEPADDIQLGDFGRILVSVDGEILEFEDDGMGNWGPAATPFFGDVMTYGGRMLTPRSRTNYQVPKHGTPDFRDRMPDEFRDPCWADVVENDVVDVDDLIEAILRWDESGGYGGFIRADVDRDGDVDVDDLLAVILAWGPCP